MSERLESPAEKKLEGTKWTINSIKDIDCFLFTNSFYFLNWYNFCYLLIYTFKQRNSNKKPLEIAKHILKVHMSTSSHV